MKKNTNILFLTLMLFLLQGGIANAQQVIGSFPTMDGGFEGQTAGALTTTLSSTAWSVQTAGTGTIGSTNVRTGSKSVNFYTASTAKRLQSPTTAVDAVQKVQYTIQYYYRTATNTATAASMQIGASPNGTSSPSYFPSVAPYATLAASNPGWTKYSAQVTVSTATSGNTGIGIIRCNTPTMGVALDIDDYVMYAGTADVTAPTAASAVSASIASTTSLTISWTGDQYAGDGGGYVIVRSTSPDAVTLNANGIYAVGNPSATGSGTVVAVTSGISGSSQSFTNTGLTTGQPYYYTIFACDKAFNYAAGATCNGTPGSLCTAPSNFTVSGTTAVCSGSTADITLSGSQSGVTYQLYKDGVVSGSTTSGTGSALTWTVSTAGTYTVQTTNAGGYCETAMTGSAVITVNQPPTTANAGSDINLTLPTVATSLAANTPSTGTGSWSIVSGPSSNLSQFSSTSSPSATFTADGGAGTYTLRWTISNGVCTSSTDDVVVTITTAVNPVIALTSGTASQTVTAGSSISNLVFTWAGSATSAAITWSGSASGTPAGLTETPDNPSKTVTVAGTPSTAGTYNYSITSTNGSQNSDPATGTITVKLAVPSVTDGATTRLNNGFTAQWADVTGESSYTINVYKTADNTLATSVTDVAANSTSTAITGLTAKTSYYYKVVAVGNGSSVPNSDESSASANVFTLSSDKVITAFSVAGQQSSSIDENLKTVSVFVASGTDITTLVPTITVSANASVNPVSGATIDFSGPVTFTVTAEDGSQQDYTATVAYGTSASDYFRSVTSGNWGSASTWESSADGINWTPSSLVPAATANAITIRNGHSVTVAATAGADQLTIENGGSLLVSTGITFTVANGTDAIDCQVNGSIVNSGTITPTGAIQYGNGGSYQHAISGGTIPAATWGTGSTCIISGTVGATSITGASQNYYNFVYNCTGQTGTCQLSWADGITIGGDVSILSTGWSGTAGKVRFTSLSGSTPKTINVNGNVNVSGSTAYLESTGSSATGLLSINVGGNINISAGSLYLVASTAPWAWNLSGDFIMTGGTLGKGSGAGTVNFVKNGVQTYTRALGAGTFASSPAFVISGNTTLDMGSSVFDGGGAFTLSAGATLKSAHASGVNGNLQTTGTKTLNAAANYVYNGSSAQVTGALLTAANNLEINNAANVTLSTATPLSGSLTLTSGKLLLGANNLTIAGTISGGSSSSYVVTNGVGKVNIPVAAATTTQVPIGISTDSYDPATVNPATATTFDVSVSSTLSGTAGELEIFYPREWNITPAVASATVLTLSPAAAVIPASMTYQPVVYHYADGSYTPLSASYTDGTFTCTASSFSPFVTGEGLATTALPVSAVGAKAFTRGNQLIVNGNSGETVTVYNLSGQAIREIRTTDSQTAIPLKKGLYIVSVRSANALNSFKVCVK